MKKEDLKKIRQAAAQLPTIHEKRKVGETGSALIDRLKSEGKKVADRDGKPIKPKYMYSHIETVAINHENKMKQIFLNAPKGKGHDAVFQYCQAVMDVHEKELKEKAAKLETMSV